MRWKGSRHGLPAVEYTEILSVNIFEPQFHACTSGRLVPQPTEPSQILLLVVYEILFLVVYELDKCCAVRNIYFTKPKRQAQKLKCLHCEEALINVLEHKKSSVWGSAPIETMTNLCPKFLAFHGKLTEPNFVFCHLIIPVSLALAKDKQDSWKSTKSRTWRTQDPQKREARSLYPVGKTND